MFLYSLLPFSLCFAAVLSLDLRKSNGFASGLEKYSDTAVSLEVDLGYAVYQGTFDSTTGLNKWKGIRYAAPPIGNLRWQAPQPPITDRSAIIQADAIPNSCPQSPRNMGDLAASIASVQASSASEDCLFLNVYAPQDAVNLPILVSIHGGGYGEGGASGDLSAIINSNANGFIVVDIQYRLGAFGFLSSEEVKLFGAVNAGTRDQTFALQWIQTHIHLFGGDPSRVTISGISAGGGSVLLQTMLYGGNFSPSLFQNAIAASPYLPKQYNYNDQVPSNAYYAFAQTAGCSASENPDPNTSGIFQCLIEKDTATLQTASATISASGNYGTWTFVPVTDGDLVQNLPSDQLQNGQLNGARLLTSNVANEAPPFVPLNITTEESLTDYLHISLPFITSDEFAELLQLYPGSTAPDDSSSVRYATSGTDEVTAIDMSPLATGHQQRAYNIYAELTFACPSYWLAEAFSARGLPAFKYQYSVTPALHGEDTTGYLGPASAVQGPDLSKAMMAIWGNFAMLGNPSIPSSVAAGASATTDAGDGQIANWPLYNSTNRIQINLNQTGGTETTVTSIGEISIIEYVGDGLRNKFNAVDAWDWEGGRGVRCEFWKRVGRSVPA